MGRSFFGAEEAGEEVGAVKKLRREDCFRAVTGVFLFKTAVDFGVFCVEPAIVRIPAIELKVELKRLKKTMGGGGRTGDLKILQKVAFELWQRETESGLS